MTRALIVVVVVVVVALLGACNVFDFDNTHIPCNLAAAVAPDECPPNFHCAQSPNPNDTLGRCAPGAEGEGEGAEGEGGVAIGIGVNCAAHPTDVLAKAGTMLRLDFIRRETGR